MKLRNILTFLLILYLLTLLLTGCAEVAKDTIIDCRHNEAYTETVTDYENKYNLMSDDWQYVANVHTVYHPESYELYHEYTYDDGSVSRVWKECTRKEYLEIMGELYGQTDN